MDNCDAEVQETGGPTVGVDVVCVNNFCIIGLPKQTLHPTLLTPHRRLTQHHNTQASPDSQRYSLQRTCLLTPSQLLSTFGRVSMVPRAIMLRVRTMEDQGLRQGRGDEQFVHKT